MITIPDFEPNKLNTQLIMYVDEPWVVEARDLILSNAFYYNKVYDEAWVDIDMLAWNKYPEEIDSNSYEPDVASFVRYIRAAREAGYWVVVFIIDRL